MILSGDPVKGEHASSCGLVDALFDNDQKFRAHVLGFATRVSHEGGPKCQFTFKSDPNLPPNNDPPCGTEGQLERSRSRTSPQDEPSQSFQCRFIPGCLSIAVR